MNKKLILILIIGIFLISLASATTLGTFRQDDCVNLIQTCSNCTYNNISNVLFPNSTIAVVNATMDKDDTYYNYSFCSTETTGIYIVNGYGDLGGTKTIWNYDFEITPTGEQNIFSFQILLFVLLCGITIFGFYIKNEWVAILGGLGLLTLGIFSWNQGISDFNNDLTNLVSLVVIALGAIVSIVTGLEIIDNAM